MPESLSLNHIPPTGFKSSPFPPIYTATFAIGRPFLLLHKKQSLLDCEFKTATPEALYSCCCGFCLLENGTGLSAFAVLIWFCLRWVLTLCSAPERRLPFAFSQSNFLIPWPHSLPGWLTRWSSCLLQPQPHLTGLVSRSLSCLVPVNFVIKVTDST